MKAELLSDYEVVAQYQTFNLESVQKLEFDKNIIFENTNNIFFEIIKNNFYDYLKLSLFHYLGNWSIGSKERFLNDNYKKVPLYQELVKSSGPINLPNQITLGFAQIIFVLFLFILTIHNFYIFYFVFLKSIVNKSIFINSSDNIFNSILFNRYKFYKCINSKIFNGSISTYYYVKYKFYKLFL